MIEEIVRPDTTIYPLIGIAVTIILGAIWCVIMIKTENQSTGLGIILALTIASFVVLLMIILTSYASAISDEWKEQVDEQIESLDCSEFEDAYNIYGLESIKEKYRSKCIDIKEEWWK